MIEHSDQAMHYLKLDAAVKVFAEYQGEYRNPHTRIHRAERNADIEQT